MIEIPDSEFDQRVPEYRAAARQEPVVIYENGKPSIVLLSVERWDQLRRLERKVGPVSEMTDEELQAMRAGIDAAYTDHKD